MADFKFDFGGSSGGGFNFGTPASTGSSGSTGFSFGSSTDSSGSSGFSFGSSTFSLGGSTASTTSSATPSFTFGAEEKKAETKVDAPASTGFNFSFGGSTDTASSASTSSAASSTSTSTFSFGDTGSSSLGSTFSFGAATDSAATSSSSASTGGLSFSFGGATDTAATSTTASTTTTTTAAAAPLTEPASRIKSRTVEEIIALWNKDLEEHVAAFLDQATEVKKWDQQLIENGNKIINLQLNVEACRTAQIKLNRVIETIKINQQEMFNLVTQLERALGDLQRADLKPGPDELKREEAFRMAEDIDAQLQQMQDSLQDTVRRLNQASDKTLDPNNAITQIVKILNVQVAGLQWVESAAQELDTKLRQTMEYLQKRSRQDYMRNAGYGVSAGGYRYDGNGSLLSTF